jgi:hypothetical protein
MSGKERGHAAVAPRKSRGRGDIMCTLILSRDAGQQHTFPPLPKAQGWGASVLEGPSAKLRMGVTHPSKFELHVELHSARWLSLHCAPEER